MILIIVTIVIIDQWSKYVVHNSFYLGESVTVIDGFFNLTYVRNSGAAFGFGGAFHDVIRYALFLALPVIACVWLSVLLYKSTKESLNILSWAYALILGGAIGNLIDRFTLDFVVDMFDFYHGSYHFATFNVADASISVAAGLLIIDFLFIQNKKKDLNKEPIKE